MFLRYVSDQCNTQQIYDKVILQNGGITLKSVPDCYKNQEMSNKAADNYLHALEFVPKRFKTQKMRGKAVDTYSSTIKFISEYFVTQQICDKVVNVYLFVFGSIPD